MRITIRATHVQSSDTVREYISTRLRESLAHVEERVGTLQVRLEDVNGPRGGVDKVCLIVANCGKLGTVQAESKSKNLRTAIDAAITKAKAAVTHAVDKKAARRSKVPRRRTS